MNRLFLYSAVAISGCLALSLTLVGCSTKKPDRPEKGLKDSPETTLARLCTQLARATEAMSIRDFLQELSTHIADPERSKEINALADVQRAFLQKQILRDADETEEVDSVTFRPMDAHYLESSFLLRDVARHLERATRDPVDGSTLTPLEQAQFTFGWVNRQVLPGLAYPATWLAPATPDSWIPSQIVLRRGFGSPRDRALLFLDLLRQTQIEGCLLDSPHPLVGVVHNGELYLFDPVLGMPVPADTMGKGIATLAAVRERPELLKPLGISAENFAKCEIVLNCPLSALAPRMKVLEELLKTKVSPEELTALFGENVSLFIDAPKLQKDVEGIVQKSWKDKAVTFGSALPNRLAPTRVLYSFLPPDEGGRKPRATNPKEVETDVRNRQDRLRQAGDPFGDEQIVYNCNRLRLSNSNFLNPDAYLFLFRKAKDVIKLFCHEPREMMVRGQYSALQKRLERVADLVDSLPNVYEADFQKDLIQWRNRIHKFVEENKPLSSFWGQDRLFEGLLNVNSDVDLRALQRVDDGNDDIKERKLRPKMLTDVELGGCCRVLLDQHVFFLQYAIVQEKAEAAQARYEHLKARADKLRAGKTDEKKVRDADARVVDAFKKARDEWLNVSDLWSLYIRKFKLDSPVVISNFQDIRTRGFKRDYATVEILQRAWSANCTARFHLIGAIERTPENEQQNLKSAGREFEAFENDLKRLDSEEFKTLLNLSVETTPLLDQFRGANLQALEQRVAYRKNRIQRELGEPMK
jgi:hypothetical protein